MGKAGAILKLIIQWFVVPLALLAIGFYFIGPKIGAVVTNSPKEIETDPQNVVDNSQTAPAPQPVPRHGEPEVEITVRRGGQFRMRKTSDHRKRHHKKKAETNAAAPAPPQIPLDNAGQVL